ncbi:NYN domain-containing protein, partial [Methylobacterium radiotolerans]
MDHLDIVVLGSGDGDYTDIVEVLQERGKRVEVI